MNWTKLEVDLIIADYMKMLIDELKSQKYNKTEHRKALLPLLNNRNHGAIERKHQNISAVLISLGLPYISGYKPLGNFQTLLAERIIHFLETQNQMISIVQKSALCSTKQQKIKDYLGRVVDPPTKRDLENAAPKIRIPFSTSTIGVNYIHLETRNRTLGTAGELFVIEYEKARLISLDRANLADKVEHVAVTMGDGLGFDVRSYEKDGSDRLIEVKTTACGIMMPFYLTRNEVAVSQIRQEDYHLYRIFKYRNDPGMFVLRGALDKVCKLEPSGYRATIG